MEGLESNIFDTALIFEGGGMRESYTAAIANALLEEGVYFDHVYGVSAGSSNAVNYVSRDRKRVRESFTSIVEDPQFGDVHTFLRHEGAFNAQRIYMEMGKPDGKLPFDMGTYLSNPANVTISAFERDTGRSLFWTKNDTGTLDALMRRVRASSTLPVVMPPIEIEGRYCYDGGLAEGNGLLVPRARRDGFERFFIVRTRPKSFRKPEKPSRALNAFFWRRPAMRRALAAWGSGYNAMCDATDRLVAEGRAYVVYAEDMTAENSTKDQNILEKNYAMGTAQAHRDISEWKRFLGL